MTATANHIARLNWGVLRADWDHPAMAGFVDNLDRLAARDASPEASDFPFLRGRLDRTEAA